MKTLHKPILTLILLVASLCSFAQDKDKIKSLIEQGIALNDSGKYTQAIDRYKEALSLDGGNIRAQYEMSYTLSVSGRAKEAIPYLEKVIASNSYAEAYDLIASIYDDDKDFDKATAYYKQGLTAFPKYQRLHFNLGVSYLRQKKYAEAEDCAIDAIKLDPKHASSQRVYALATYAENKRIRSLLAWCNFLILEPQTNRSSEAYNYVKTILNYGIKHTGEKSVTLTVSSDDSGIGNLLMQSAILTSTDKAGSITDVDALALQLASVFAISDEIETDKKQTFFLNYYSKYFKELSASGNMPAFARLVSLSGYKEENIQWIKDNDAKFNALDLWIRTTERKF